MQADVPIRILHILLDPYAGMAAVVVHRQVQCSVATIGS
jgi:hypothetical protein